MPACANMIYMMNFFFFFDDFQEPRGGMTFTRIHFEVHIGPCCALFLKALRRSVIFLCQYRKDIGTYLGCRYIC